MLEMVIMLLSFILFGVFWAACAVLYNSTPMLSADDV